MLGQLNNALQRIFGLPYLFASRDFSIHSRCRYLLHKLQRVRGQSLAVLDVGCGAGITLRHLATSAPGRIGRYVGIDRQAERLQAQYRDVDAIDVDFHNIDLDDEWDVGRFDVVWCSEVIEHLMDDSGQIRKMMRAVKPGGMVLITAPCFEFVKHIGACFPPILNTSATQDGGRVRHGYRIEDMERLAFEAGLLIESIDGVNRLTLAETQKRYTARGVARIWNNIRMGWRARDQEDFALGDAFKKETECYASISAVLRRPAVPVRGRPAPEMIDLVLPKRDIAKAARSMGSDVVELG